MNGKVDLLLKVVQSLEVSNPSDNAEAVGMFSVWTEPEEEKPNPPLVDVVAKVCVGAVKPLSEYKSPREEVAVRLYPPVELPRRILPYEGDDDRPVPPYKTPIDVVAETTPALACKGPLNELKVSVPLNMFAPLQVLAEYVFGIVVDPLT